MKKISSKRIWKSARRRLSDDSRPCVYILCMTTFRCILNGVLYQDVSCQVGGAISILWDHETICSHLLLVSLVLTWFDIVTEFNLAPGLGVKTWAYLVPTIVLAKVKSTLTKKTSLRHSTMDWCITGLIRYSQLFCLTDNLTTSFKCPARDVLTTSMGLRHVANLLPTSIWRVIVDVFKMPSARRFLNVGGCTLSRRHFANVSPMLKRLPWLDLKRCISWSTSNRRP